LAADPARRRVVLKPLDEDCLLKGNLHPLIKDRLGRVRELAHLGVANLLGVERLDGQCFLVWQHVEGQTLEDYLDATEKGPQALRGIALRLVQSVESLHALGIVHGALHARNIIVEPDGALRLTHISPLLYTDVAVDIEALLELLRDLGHEQPEQEELPALRQVAAQLSTSPKAPAEPAEQPAAARDGIKLRRAALIGAAAATVLGAAVAWGVWWYSSRQAEREPAYPEIRSAADPREARGWGGLA
jgi:hypothetical protein